MIDFNVINLNIIKNIIILLYYSLNIIINYLIIFLNLVFKVYINNFLK